MVMYNAPELKEAQLAEYGLDDLVHLCVKDKTVRGFLPIAVEKLSAKFIYP